MKPVAYRVKDFADGWILCDTMKAAQKEAEGAGNLIEPRYPAPMQLQAVEAERDELQATLDLQQSRVRIVTKEWQKAHGKPNVLPDLGMLIDWMWGQTKVCEFLIAGQLKPGEKLEDLYCPLCGNQLPASTPEPPETVECCPTCAGVDRAHPGSIMRKYKDFPCGDPLAPCQMNTVLKCRTHKTILGFQKFTKPRCLLRALRYLPIKVLGQIRNWFRNHP